MLNTEKARPPLTVRVNPAMPFGQAEYSVLVGNIGNINTDSYREAIAEYYAYVSNSKAEIGRAAQEDVCILEDGEPIERYAFCWTEWKIEKHQFKINNLNDKISELEQKVLSHKKSIIELRERD